MAVRQELILGTTQARREAADLERILDQAVRDLKVTFDRSAIQGLERQLAALKVDIDASGAVRLRDAIEDTVTAGRRLDDELDESATAAGLLERNLAEASGELREGQQLALRLDDELDEAAAAARRTAGALGTVSATGLTPAVAQAGNLSTQLLLAQGAAATLSRQQIVQPQQVVAAEGLATSMARLRATAITTPDIARQLGLSAVAASGNAAAGGMGATLKAMLPLAGVAVAVGLGFRTLSREISLSTAAASLLAESTSKARVVFGADLAQVTRALGDTSKTVLLSRQAAFESVATFGNLFQALGSSRQEAARLSPVVVKLAADLASFNNLNLDDALLKLRSGLVGEIEPLRSLGISFNAAQVDAKALELGLANANGEVSEGAKVQARLALILEQTTAAQGDVARTADGYANTQRRVQAATADLRAEIGERLIPGQLALLAAQEKLLPSLRDFGVAGAEAFSSVAGGAASFLGVMGELLGGADDLSRGLALFGERFQGLFTFDDAERNLNDLQTATLEALQFVDESLRKGEDAATAFANGLFHVAQQGPVTADIVKRLGFEAGLTAEQVQAATVNLITLAIASGAPIEEIENLRAALAEMNAEIIIAGGGGAGQHPRRAPISEIASEAGKFVQALEGASASSKRFNDDLQTLTDAGLTNLVAKLQEIGGPEAEGLASQLARNLTLAGTAEDFLRPALDIPALLDQIATDAAAARDRVREAINPFEGAAEQIKISAAEFTANVEAQINQQAQLEAGTAFLEALGFDKLADSLRAEGPGAIAAMQTFLNDVTAAGEAEALFEGLATDQVTAYSEQVKAGLIAAGVDPELIAAISTTIDNPTVRAAFETAAGGAVSGVGDAITTSITGRLQPAIDAAFGIFQAPDLGTLLFPKGKAADDIGAAFAADDALTNSLIDEAGLAIDAYERGLANRLAEDRLGIEGEIADTIAARFASDDALTNAALAGEEDFDAFTRGIRTRLTARDWGIEGELADGIGAAFANDDALTNAALAGKALADAFEKGTREGLGMASPSKVFIQIAREAVASFRDAVEADLSRGLNIKFPVTGGMTGSAAAGGNVNLTVIGSRDTSRSTTRAAVHAQQVSNLLGIVPR